MPYPYPVPTHQMPPGMPPAGHVSVVAPSSVIPPTTASTASVELSATDQLRSKIESSIGAAKLTTVFVGNIADGVTDEMLSILFGICGHVKKWRRALDATGQPKTFGFLEFVLAEGLSRLIRLLKDCPILGKPLNIKADEPTMEYIGKYQAALKAHEAANPDAPRLSFMLEDDLKALEEINQVFKEKNLSASLQFIERKVQELTVGPVEVPQVILEHPKDQQAEEKMKRRDSSEEKKMKKLTGWETSGYREREKRWEHREGTVLKSREQQLQREVERSERERQDKAKLIDWLDAFDDNSFFLLAMDRIASPEDRTIERRLASCNAPSFYLDRDKWRERRKKDLQRQIDLDDRNEKRDVEMGIEMDQAGLGKRTLGAPSKVSKRTRPPLIPISYTYEQLLEAGHDAETAMAKLSELKKEKIKKLIQKIPTEQEELFEWDIDWDLIEMTKLIPWIQKAVGKWEAVREKEVLSKDLESWINNKSSPNYILKNLEGLPEANLFLMRLWRYIIFETEASAYGLQ